MSTQHTQPPWEFLLTASRNTLHSYELSRLGHAANLRKEFASLLDQWLEETANAMVARWLIEQRQQSVRAAATEAQADPAPEPPSPAASSNGHSVSDNLLTDRLVRPNVSRSHG